MDTEKRPAQRLPPIAQQDLRLGGHGDSVRQCSDTNSIDPLEMFSKPLSLTATLFKTPHGTRFVANMIALLLPTPMTALGFFLIAVKLGFVAFARRDCAFSGALCGTATILPQLLIANFASDKYRIWSTAISVAIVTVAFVYYYDP
jgi:hypothetical protein